MENCNFICEYDNIMPNDLLDDLITHFNDNKSQARPGVTGKTVLNTNIKDSLDLFVADIPPHLNAAYVAHLQICLNQYLKTYDAADDVASFSIREGYQLQYYKPGGGYKKWHAEVNCNPDPQKGLRHLVFMTYLNTLENGGTEFLYQNLKIDAVKGRTVIWPAYWTHTHRGVISQTEEKYIITGWFNFNE